jgi:hypothetical protein
MKTLAFFFVMLFGGFSTNGFSQSLSRVGGGGGSVSIPTERLAMKSVSPESAQFRAIFADVSVLVSKQRQLDSIVTIRQTLSPEFFLAEINGDKSIAIRIPGRTLADDAELTLKVENTGTVHRYTDVLGAVRTVPIYKITNSAERFTHAKFIALLRAGETFSLRRASGASKKELLVVWE